MQVRDQIYNYVLVSPLNHHSRSLLWPLSCCQTLRKRQVFALESDLHILRKNMHTDTAYLAVITVDNVCIAARRTPTQLVS